MYLHTTRLVRQSCNTEKEQGEEEEEAKFRRAISSTGCRDSRTPLPWRIVRPEYHSRPASEGGEPGVNPGARIIRSIHAANINFGGCSARIKIVPNDGGNGVR